MLMLVQIKNKLKKIIRIKLDYTFLGIISLYAKRKTQRRLRLKAIHTSTHSPWTVSSPRSMKRRKPITSLIIPNTGSTVDLPSAPGFFAKAEMGSIQFQRRKIFLAVIAFGDPRSSCSGIGSEEAAASVCPQNRAYGSVHGSSCKSYPLRNIKPMRQLSVGSYFLSFQVNKPTIGVGSRHRSGV
jgi:hypothetical protein